jgi:hypothetical protein
MDFKVRLQQYEYRVMKEYEYGRTSLVETFPDYLSACDLYDSYGGSGEQEDYNGKFRFYLEEGWTTSGHSS